MTCCSRGVALEVPCQTTQHVHPCSRTTCSPSPLTGPSNSTESDTNTEVPTPDDLYRWEQLKAGGSQVFLQPHYNAETTFPAVGAAAEKEVFVYCSSCPIPAGRGSAKTALFQWTSILTSLFRM